MGMATDTEEAHYAEGGVDGGAAYEIEQGAVIIDMETADLFAL